MTMSPNNNEKTAVVKNIKPPPPVPPRPSKFLVKEALEKSRQTHLNICKPTQSPDKLEREVINRIIPNKLSERPIIYQSNINNNSNKSLNNDNDDDSENKHHIYGNLIKRNNSQNNPKKIDRNNSKKNADNNNSTEKIIIHEKSPPSSATITTNSSHEELLSTSSSSSVTPNSTLNRKKDLDDLLVDRNHVNTLIDEMFASVLEVNSTSSSINSSTSSIENVKISSNNNNLIHAEKSLKEEENLTVIVINNNNNNNDDDDDKSSSLERKVKFNDQQNHEFLIKELQDMNNTDKIQTNDWYGVNDGKKVKLSSCYIQIEDTGGTDLIRNEKINTISKAYHLPPLPKSLEGFKFIDDINKNEIINKENVDESSELHVENLLGRQETKLDRQLAILRREMLTLREQDLNLLSKLWFLSESIHDFRQMVQEQEEDKFSLRMTPSPTPSSIEDEEDFYVMTSTSTC